MANLSYMNNLKNVENIMGKYQKNPWIGINNISKKNFFQLLIIVIVVIIVGKILGFSLIIIVLLIIGMVYLGRSYQEIKQLDPADQKAIKTAFIPPAPSNFVPTHIKSEKLISILFDLRQFQYLNRDSYNDIVLNTNEFCKYYNILKNSIGDRSVRKQEFDIAKDYGRAAIVALDSMIFSFNNEIIIIKQYRDIRNRFDKIINKMTYEMGLMVGISPAKLQEPKAYNDFPENSDIH